MSYQQELKRFLKEYELETNSHDFKRVRPLIAKDATYWFSDGTHEGIDAIEKAFTRTWKKIKDEHYQIMSVRWITTSERVGVCVYEFR